MRGGVVFFQPVALLFAFIKQAKLILVVHFNESAELNLSTDWAIGLHDRLLRYFLFAMAGRKKRIVTFERFRAEHG